MAKKKNTTPKVSNDMQIRKYAVQVKFYRIVSILFVLIGLFLLFDIYIQYSNGDARAFIDHPLLIIMVFTPFIPSYIFSLLASRKEGKIRTLLAEKADK